MQEIIIGKNEAGQRFDKFLVKYFKEANSGFIYKMLRKKNIELNGKKATGNEKLSQGDSVKLFMADDTIAKFRGKAVAIHNHRANDNIVHKAVNIVSDHIIYEDDNIVLVNKPVGILSQKSVPSDISINEMIIDYMLDKGQITEEELQTFKPSVCNRLDRNTTGIISFGKTLKGVQELSRGFKERTFDKYYLAIVWGKVDKPSLIEGYLVKDEKRNKVSISKEKIKDSVYIKTYYEPLKVGSILCKDTYRDITLLKIKLITGKTHQIRAHLSSIGHSLLGDDKYGIRGLNEYISKQYDIKHQMLHAYELHIGADNHYDVLKSLEHKVFTAKPHDIYGKLFNN